MSLSRRALIESLLVISRINNCWWYLTCSYVACQFDVVLFGVFSHSQQKKSCIVLVCALERKNSITPCGREWSRGDNAAVYQSQFSKRFHLTNYRHGMIKSASLIFFKTRCAPTAGCRLAVGTHLVSWNCFTKSVCVCVCMYVCMYICLSFCTHVSKPFTWSLKAACIQTIKAKQSLYYTHTQVSSPPKACFFPNRKPGVATILRLRSQLL